MIAGLIMVATDDTHATTIDSGSGRVKLGLSGMSQVADAPSDGTTYGRKDGAWVNSGLTGSTGPTGIQGVSGESGGTGPTGQGLASGGTTGQVLAKVDATDFNTEWTGASSAGASGVVTGGGYNAYVGTSGGDLEFRGITTGSGIVATSGTGIKLEVAFSGAPSRVASTGTPDSGSSITAARSDHTHALDSGVSGVIEAALTGFSGVKTGGGMSVYNGMSGDDIELRGIVSGSGISLTSGTGIKIEVEFSGAPSSVASGVADSGSAQTAARSDHMHAINFSGNPSDISGVASSGSSAVPARSDHVHRFLITDTSRLLGRKSASSGGYEELVISEALGFVSGTEATGDILYKGDSAWGRLAKGAALQVLRQNSGLTAPEWATAREVLAASRTYYVRTDGNDSNTGLSDTAGGAFLTIQKAVDTAAALDAATYDVSILVRSGTYTGAVTLKNVLGAGTFSIEGDTSTPSNVVISTTSANCFSASGITSVWTIKGFKLTTTTSGNCINVGTARALFNSIEFGASAGRHIVSTAYGYAQANGNYSISGNASEHMYATGNAAQITVANRTVTLTGTPAFSNCFCLSYYGAQVLANGNTYSGGATGTRFLQYYDSLIITSGGGATYFPGDAAGTTDAATFCIYT